MPVTDPTNHDESDFSRHNKGQDMNAMDTDKPMAKDGLNYVYGPRNGEVSRNYAMRSASDDNVDDIDDLDEGVDLDDLDDEELDMPPMDDESDAHVVVGNNLLEDSAQSIDDSDFYEDEPETTTAPKPSADESMASFENAVADVVKETADEITTILSDAIKPTAVPSIVVEIPQRAIDNLTEQIVDMVVEPVTEKFRVELHDDLMSKVKVPVEVEKVQEQESTVQKTVEKLDSATTTTTTNLSITVTKTVTKNSSTAATPTTMDASIQSSSNKIDGSSNTTKDDTQIIVSTENEKDDSHSSDFVVDVELETDHGSSAVHPSNEITGADSLNGDDNYDDGENYDDAEDASTDITPMSSMDGFENNENSQSTTKDASTSSDSISKAYEDESSEVVSNDSESRDEKYKGEYDDVTNSDESNAEDGDVYEDDEGYDDNESETANDEDGQDSSSIKSESDGEDEYDDNEDEDEDEDEDEYDDNEDGDGDAADADAAEDSSTIVVAIDENKDMSSTETRGELKIKVPVKIEIDLTTLPSNGVSKIGMYTIGNSEVNLLVNRLTALLEKALTNAKNLPAYLQFIEDILGEDAMTTENDRRIIKTSPEMIESLETAISQHVASVLKRESPQYYEAFIELLKNTYKGDAGAAIEELQMKMDQRLTTDIPLYVAKRVLKALLASSQDGVTNSNNANGSYIVLTPVSPIASSPVLSSGLLNALMLSLNSGADSSKHISTPLEIEVEDGQYDDAVFSVEYNRYQQIRAQRADTVSMVLTSLLGIAVLIFASMVVVMAAKQARVPAQQ